MRLLSAISVLFLVTACQSTAPMVHPDAVSSRDAELLGEISKLAGEWEMPDESGQTQLALVFAVSSAGSSVREIMFPGSEHEMTNLYHMDGDVLVCTHYCAAGNQPRMVATAATKTDEGTELRFELDSVSNLREGHDHYMGNLTVTLLDDGRLRQVWRSYDRDGELAEPMTFLLTRKGS